MIKPLSAMKVLNLSSDFQICSYFVPLLTARTHEGVQRNIYMTH
jgi:hypothetical protein